MRVSVAVRPASREQGPGPVNLPPGSHLLLVPLPAWRPAGGPAAEGGNPVIGWWMSTDAWLPGDEDELAALLGRDDDDKRGEDEAVS